MVSATSMTIGDFLLRRLKEAGIHEIFGVPGDFNLEFMQQLEDDPDVAWIGTCNELNGAYAADGYARLNGLAALVVTHGVGALSAINGVAGAYSEHVPLVCIAGSLPQRSLERGLLMHHTFADGGSGEFLRAYSPVTAAQAQLTPQNAVSEIDRLITVAWQRKLPVYLELPSDIAYLDVTVPTSPLVLTMPDSDAERLRSCAAAIAARLRQARSPAILLDLDADRFGCVTQVLELAGAWGCPVAVMNTSKGIVDEASEAYAGIYTGAGSPPATRAAVEGSDCLLAIGHRRVDSTSGFFSDALPPDMIRIGPFSVDAGAENFQAVTVGELLQALIDAAPSRRPTPSGRPAPRIAAVTPPQAEGGQEPVTQERYWAAIQGFLRPGDVLIAEDGTSSAGATALALPNDCTFITQAVWGSIGYSLGSLLGALVAAPERRHLLFTGDGSFQLTAQELGTILRHDLKPYIFLVNNAGYTIERTILGAKARYNDVAGWDYAALPQVLAPGTKARSFTVETGEDLEQALAAPHDALIFIELRMKPEDAPLNLIRGGHASADADYGPRGPQHRAGSQIVLPSGATAGHRS